MKQLKIYVKAENINIFDCLEAVISHGHKVITLYTDNDLIMDWAGDHGITTAAIDTLVQTVDPSQSNILINFYQSSSSLPELPKKFETYHFCSKTKIPVIKFHEFILNLSRGLKPKITALPEMPKMAEIKPPNVKFKLIQLQQVFEYWVENTPNQIAVVYETEKITYAELNAKAEKIADMIRLNNEKQNDKHVLSDVVIGLYIDRGINMIAAMLGILKAGAAYLPLDPQYPEERLAFMINNSGANLVITTAEYKAIFPDKAKIFVDDIDFQEKIENSTSISQNINNLAYVIYTSGSTGEPKGVAVTHGNIINFVEYLNLNYPFRLHGKGCFWGTINFDLSLLEIWGVFLVGGTLYIVPEIMRMDGLQYFNYLSQNKIDFAFIPPFLLKTFAHWLDMHAGSFALSTLITGIEPIATSTLATIKEALPSIHIFSIYGPTEATVFATCFYYRSGYAESDIVPIGTPIKNTVLYLLDQYQRKVKLGNEGEIYIGGPGVARGYINNPSLTQEKFIQSPFDKNERLYRTGDWALLQNDGNFVFKGRRDAQIKIRGYRIELKEIEIALNKQPSIVQSVVAIKTINDEPVLVAYILSKEKTLKYEVIRKSLQRTLPNYMIPSLYMLIDKIPVMPNGKINRADLPLPDLSQIKAQYVAPSGKLERELADIWTKVLGVNDISLNDVFFNIGGHSLIMPIVILEIQQTFGIPLTVKEFISNDTLSQQAKLIAEKKASSQIVYEDVLNLPQVELNPDQQYADFPLSAIQQAFWINRQHDSSSANQSFLYHEFSCNQIDIERLEVALNKLIERHSMLRAVIEDNGYQHILSEHPYFKITLHDWSDLSCDLYQKNITELRKDIQSQFLDPRCWPLFIFHVSRYQAEDRIHFRADAMIFDSLSEIIFLNDLNAFYQGRDNTLKNLFLTYRDYQIAYNKIYKLPQYIEDKKYWLERLKQFPLGPVLPRNKKATLTKMVTHFQDSIDISDLLKKANQYQVALNTVLLTAYIEVLRKWSSVNHFSINLMLYNRLPLDKEVSDIIGPFTSSLIFEVARKKIGESFLITAAKTHEQLATDLQHRLYSGIEFQAELNRLYQKETRAAIAIVFNSTVNLSHELSTELLSGNFKHTPYDRSVKSDVLIDCNINKVQDQLEITWGCQENQFPARLISEMFSAYMQILKELAVREWGESFDILSLRDKQIVERANALEQAPPQFCLHQRFANQVKLTPQHIAVYTTQHEISYQTLQTKVNQLAHALLKHAVKPNQLIAIYLKKGWLQVLASLGILTAGAAYLPLTPLWPHKRVQEVLEQGESTIVISETESINKIKNHLKDSEKYTFINLEDTEWLTQFPSENPEVLTHLNDIAYVIFTSGTTGKPKGVTITHKNVVNTLNGINRFFKITEKDRTFSLSKITFDLSVYDIFGPLVVGGAVVFPEWEKMLEPSHWLELIEKYGITIWNSVPAFMQIFVDYLDFYHSTSIDSIRLVLLSGDWIEPKLPTRIYKHFPLCEVISLGGATEGSIWSIYFPVPRNGKFKKGIPYGYALANQHMYVLNETLEHCPVNVIGDIYIGGMGVAQGYWQDPEKTEQNFIYHPATDEYLYRTGDLGRWSKNGYIEYMGRSDTQIKIAGHRIELSEISSILLQNAQVLSCAVIHVSAESAYEIIAFYTTHKDASPTLAVELKEHLASLLPAYMLPKKLIKLETIPLTENGKIDKESLVTIYNQDKMVVPTRTSFVKTQAESILAEIWGDILSINPHNITPEDNFFDLGGHSLLIIQTLLAIHQKLGGTITVRNFVESKSLRDLLRHIQKSDQIYPTLTPDPAQENEPFPLTDVQQAYWLGRHGGLDLSEMSTHIYQEFTLNANLPWLEQALNQLIQRHGMLRAILPSAAEQRILPKAPYYKIQIQDLSQLNEDEQQIRLLKIRQEMSHQNLDSNQWPLFDIRASRLTQDKLCLHVSIDALILDAWSLDILFAEWAMLYHDSNKKLKPLTLSFRDYILGLEEVKQTEQYNQDKQYWINRLNDLPAGPDIPKLKRAHALKNQRTRSQRTEMNPNIWGALKAAAKKHNILSATILMAVFAEVLSHWSATQHYVLNLTLFNRLPLHPDVNSILGDFTSLNMLEINHQNINGTSFLERAKILQDQLLRDLDHRLFSGVAVQRELSKMSKSFAVGTRVPIVFTSILDEEHQFYEDSESPFAYQNMNFRSTQSSQVWLDHKAYVAGGALISEWDYVAELFPEKLIENMHQAFCDILTRLAVEPELWTQTSSLFKYHALTEVQQQPFAQADALLHELFINNVNKIPTHPAIITINEEISYAALSERVAQIAMLLSDQGVSTNQLVGVCMPKSWHQVVATLAILYAGAAYVPLDPDLPVERRRSLILETKIQIILTTKEMLETVAKMHNGNTKWIAIDDEVFLTQLKPLHYQRKQSSNDLAYVTYTSGTTGKPKGIMINHSAVVNTILDVNNRFQLEPTDRVLALSHLNFDLSVFDIFGTLAFGGSIVIPEAKQEKDPAHWLQLLLQKKVTVWNSVPAFMKMLTNYIQLMQRENEIKNESRLRLVLLSGDWIPLDLPQTLLKIFGSVDMISLGGATEASIWSVIYPIDPQKKYERSIPYGKALQNQAIYVLNKQLQPCPTWVSGDIYIGGKGLAMGYWENQEKTDAQFILHPETTMRLYKTGDCGRLLPDGNVEFLGRQDFQVKVNGFRIELEEIDENIKTFPSIDNALSIVQDSVGQKIIAFYSTKNKTALEEQKLKMHLRQWLPNYMIPAHLVWIEEFPLTDNGKIDRKVFQATARTYIPAGATHIKHLPTTELQKSLAAIFKDELNITEIDIQDNFFDLGADSLTLVNVYSKISQKLKINLSMTELFNYPNLQSLAEFIAHGKTTAKTKEEATRRSQLRKVALHQRQKKRNRHFSRGA